MQQCNFNRTVNRHNDQFCSLLKKMFFLIVGCEIVTTIEKPHSRLVMDYVISLQFSGLVSFLKNFMRSHHLRFFLM